MLDVNGIMQKKIPNTTATIQPQTTKTPYQQLFSQPVQQEWKVGDKPTTYGQALATINDMAKTDQVKATEKLNLLNQYRTQPGNMWYDPFAAATNNAVSELASYGIDPAALTADWFNANTNWQGYLNYNGTTTTPSKPGKKASEQEKVAYALYQFQKSMDVTSSAKNEWAAAQNEINYWANRKDLNLSDDDIISRVFGSSKYSTLGKMDSTRTTGAPLELNEAIDYNPDSVRGVIWAARNGGGTGNIRQDIANYYSKVGNVWQNNDSISAKLNKNDVSTYSPYEVGMTGKDMDEAGAYFGASSFAPGSIEELRSKVDWNDATSVKMFQKVVDAEQTTLKAEEELANFNKLFENRMKRGFANQEEADAWIDQQLNSGAYNTLAKMDEGILKGSPINLTRAVSYRKQMYQQAAADAIANPPKSGSDVLNSYGANVPDSTKATTKVENENVATSFDAMEPFLTTDEKDYLNAVPGVEFNSLVSDIGRVKGNIAVHAEGLYRKANGAYGDAVLSSIPIIDQYQKYREAANQLSAKVGEFELNNKKRILAGEDIQQQKIVETDDAYVELYMGTDGKYTVDEQTERMMADAAYEDLQKNNPDITWEECFRMVQEKDQRICDEENEHVEAIRNARAETGESGLNTPEEIAQYQKDKEQLNALYEWIGNHSEEYRNANRAVSDAKMKRDAIGDIAARSIGAEYDPTVADSIIEYAGGFYQYEAPPLDGHTLIEEVAGMGALDVKKIVDNNNAGIKDVKFALSALGNNAPEEIVKKMNAAIADAEKENRVLNDYLITNDPNYDALVAQGRKWALEHSNDMGEIVAGSTSRNWFGFMKPEEKDIFYAMLARDGIDAADQFYKDIRDELQQRRENDINDNAERIAKSGWLGRLAGEAGAILMAPINTLSGAAYAAGVALGADEAEMRAAKQSSHISQSMHSANINELKNIYGEDTALGQFLTGAYEILYNRGNSFMNAITWGKLMPQFAGEGKLVGFFNDVLSATPIAFSAASDALENAIDRGANPAQQALIFGATLIAESWTEGIEFGHIEKARKALLTKEGITKFLKDYIPTALSEVVGETTNDLVENAADEWVKYINNPDYKSQHDLAIEEAMAKDKTLTPEQAETLVHQAEVASVLHTAVISFFSPGADVLAMTGNTLVSYAQYAQEARDYNQGITGKHAKKKTIRDIRLEHEAAEAAKSNPKPVAEETATAPAQETATQQEQYSVNGPDESRARSYAKAMNEYDSNIILLEEAADANATAQAAAIASAISTGNDYAAQAAAAKLNLGMVQALMVAGRQGNINMATLAQGIQLAALGNGVCADVLNNGLANGLSAVEMASQIAAGVSADMQNPAVAQGVAAGIHNARVGEEFKRLMAGLETTATNAPTNANEAMERLTAGKAVKAIKDINDAREQTKIAEENFERSQNELAAAQQGVSEAAAAIAENPIDDGNQLTGALAKMTSAAAVVEEFRQALEKARANQQKVESESLKLAEETTANLRKQAESSVMQQEQAEAQARVEAEAQAQAEAQAAAIAEDEMRQQGNIDRLDADTFIEQTHPNATEEQKEQIRAAFQKVKEQMGKTADSHLARKQFEERFAKRFGLTVRHVDSVDENGRKFTLFNARINPKTGELLVNKNATQDDMFYAVLIHEITHRAEGNKNAYAELADAVLQMRYGKDVTYQGILDLMQKGDVSSRLAQDILGKKGLYDKQLDRSHTNEEMLQEIVADEVGKVISGDHAALESLVAEKPSVAKRILDGIRNFLKNMVGIKSPAVTQAQQIADMLTAALEGNSVQTQETPTSTRKYNGNGKFVSTYDAIRQLKFKGDSVIEKIEGHGDALVNYLKDKNGNRVAILDNSGRFLELLDPSYADKLSESGLISDDGKLWEENLNPNRHSLPSDDNPGKEGAERYSLPPVEPVEPSNDSWGRDTIQTFPDLQATFPNIYNIQDDRTEDQKKNDTSVAITLSTYRKIFDKLKGEGFNGTILDASSGLGLGTKAGREEYGMAVDDIEPYPNPGYTPSEGTDYSKLDKKYDVIISNAVLNVLTQDQRDALVTKMGDLLNDGGRMFINVRSIGDVANLRKNLDTEWVQEHGEPSPENPYTGKKNIQIGENEYYTGRGTYQKGFTPHELASYVLDVLGPGYSVEIDNKKETSGSSASGIVVTKNDSVRYSLPSDEDYLAAVESGDTETMQQMVDEAAERAGYNIKAIHGTNAEFNTFEKGDIGYHFGTEAQANAKANQKVNNHGGNTRMISSYIKMDNPLVLDFDAYSWDAPLMAARYIAYEDHEEAGLPYDESETSTKVYRMFKNLGITDSDIERLRSWDDGNQYFDEILERNGYDGIIYKNEVESNENAYSYIVPLNKGENIKVADPVSYDDNGNVIPLSERFNNRNEDIRYSLPSDETLAQQIQQWLNENGLEDADLSDSEARTLYQNLPRDGKQGDGVRQWAVKGAQASDEIDEAAKRYVFANRFYKKQTNAEQLANAIRWIHSNATEDDPTGYHKSLEIVMDDNFEYRTADGQAQMIAVIGMAAARKDTYAQVALADAYDRQGTDLGRALQLRNIWRLMTPEGRRKSLKNMVDKLDMELKRKGTHVDLKLSDWIYEAAAMAEDEGEMARVRNAAKQELAEQLPANWKDRVRSFRIFAMLANPRTHVRNFLGNFLFVPAVSLKNKIGAVMELSKPQGERTKTLAVRLDSDIRAFARQDAIKRKDELTGDSRWKEGDSVKREQKPFTGKMSWLQKAIDWNGNKLEAEDWFFLRGHYARALGGWMQANGYSVADMEEHPEWLEKGRAYAQSEAQKATYRDFNAVANKLNQISRQGGFFGFLVDATLPFKKTPANIVKRGMEYSVVGLAKSLSTDLYHLHQYNVAKANGETIMPDKAITPNEFIDHLSAGLTGTAVMALGAFLSSLGIVTVGLDDDDDTFEKTKGGQEYALRIKIGDDEVTYTLDWAAPMCMPFFVGASIYEQLTKDNDGLTLREVINSISSIAEPVFNLSMLDGVNSLLRTNSYDGMPELTQILGKIASNYATSFVPAAFGTITRIRDDYRRKAFVKSGEGGDMMGTWLYAWEQTENKIYPLARTNIPYRNIWGEAEGDAPLERWIENIASPGYLARTRKDPIIDEMERLYSSEDVSETKRKALVPKMPSGKVGSIALEPEQYDRITVERGQTAKKVLTDLLNSQFYKTATDNEKATMVSEAWDYATQIADNVVMGKKLESWVSNSVTNPVQGIINRQKNRNVSDAKNEWKAEAVKAVQAEDYEALDVCIEALNELGVSADSVKTAVGNAYKPEYIRAYQTGDRQKMTEIESILDMSGLGFDKVNRQGMDTYDQWIADMNKQVAEEEI